MKKKMLIISGHFSTGGAPACTLKKIELIKDDFDIKVVEYSFLASMFVVQRNRIINLVGAENFYSLGSGDTDTQTKSDFLMSIIEKFRPDIISMEEFPEMFLAKEIADKIYTANNPLRSTYKIYETTHDSSFNPKNKIYFPDEFIFVSPYNALKYNDLPYNIPVNIIEYPIDIKQRDKAASRKKLGLRDDYRHVVIIGLFTARKNQKYCFEIAEKLADYKIQFHFIGNLAGNFQHYWQPILEWKDREPRLSNCIIWGERDDTDEFLQAADLFLFASLGKNTDKELNPIVLKEGAIYKDLPKLLFNLDVYLNRYNNKENFFYLDGDLNKDAAGVKLLTIPNPIENKEEIVIIGTYPNLKKREELTIQCIEAHKPLGRKIMLISHYPVSDDIQRMVDYYIYDSDNVLTHHSYYSLFYNHTNDYDADLNINGLKKSNQSLTVLMNIFTAFKAAKGLGYKRAFYNTYDIIINDTDIPAIETAFKTDAKCYLATLDTQIGKGIQTNGMMFDIDFFLQNFNDIRTADEYNKACEKIGAQNFLENYLIKKVFTFNANDVELITNERHSFLHTCEGASSNSEYYSILPIEGRENHFMFYFFTYNVDDRKIDLFIEHSEETTHDIINISKQKEFKKEIVYDGRDINVTMDFIDNGRVYKTETFSINKNNLDIYKNAGTFKFKNIKPVKPVIKIVHIQTTLNTEAEQKSRESLYPLSKYFEYILQTNQPYTSLPPAHNCMRPQCVSMELFDEETVQKLGTALSPSHYGCYEAFKNATLSEFHDCDFLIIAEGDCIIEKPDEMVDIIYKAAEACNEHNIGYFSFGDKATLEHGWEQSPVIEDVNDFCYITNHIIGLQFVMFSKNTEKFLKHNFRKHAWDASDLFYNLIFRHSQYKMGILHERATTQHSGWSLIDQQEKKFI